MLDSRFYEKLKRFRLRMKYHSQMQSEGGRTVRKKGKSMDFSGFREYVPGDDIRFLDWNGYARSEKLNIKEFMEERESQVTILLDQSMSMQEDSKMTRSLELAFSLAVMAALGGDRVRVVTLADGTNEQNIMGQKSELTKLRHFLLQREYKGEAHLTEEMRRLVVKGPGLCIVISDFLEENVESSLKEAIGYLVFQKQDVQLLQVLSGEELAPSELGTFQLIDSEDEKKRLRIMLDRMTREKYITEVERYVAALASIAKSKRAGYHLCNTEKSFDRILMEDLRELYD